MALAVARPEPPAYNYPPPGPNFIATPVQPSYHFQQVQPSTQVVQVPQTTQVVYQPNVNQQVGGYQEQVVGGYPFPQVGGYHQKQVASYEVGVGNNNNQVTGYQQILTGNPHVAVDQVRPQEQPRTKQVLVTKNIYVHTLPDEHAVNEQILSPEQTVLRKNYKIIFIKAPSSSQQYQQQLGAALNREQEKTIIYVLSKKPEALEDIRGAIPDAVSPPSKPEVYFIKYKAQKKAGHGTDQTADHIIQKIVGSGSGPNIGIGTGPVISTNCKSPSLA